MPRSIRRVTEVAESFVCSVEKTRWPVSAACTAFCAVSSSRISPTMMMSGSWRRIVRSADGERDADLGLHRGLVEVVAAPSRSGLRSW